ncbi:MAG: GPW/gp25 family protein [Planctomycetaceae bacterium]|nr:GPW/gp25 family protein [Planctomycetaceae bacterium]MCA9108392.1 GPW/gp25 family protein [Planctomycetaceae bacterium]
MGRTQSVAPAGLFDRMRHEAPSIESADDYRNAVLLDLQDLLGTIRRWTPVELAEFPEVNRSVVNFGVAPITGRIVSRDTANELAREVRACILQFDPRFDPASFEVRPILDSQRTPLDALTIELEGNLRGLPKPVPFFVRVAADLDSGLFVLIPETAAA